MKRIVLASLLSLIIPALSLPTAMATDATPPQLVDWEIQTTVVDISNSPGKVVVKFILSDDSSINEPKLLVKSLETTQMSSFAIVKEVARSGKLVSYEATATINVGQSPREWEWVLYPLSDGIGNSNNSFGPAPIGVGKFLVFDKVYTLAQYRNFQGCLSGLRNFNRVLTRFVALQKTDPNNIKLSVLKLKFSLPESVIDEKLCETDTLRIASTYGPNEVVEFADALSSIAEEIDTKNALAAAAARDVAAKSAAEELARQQSAANAKTVAQKKSTITCVKGKLSKKVTAIKPICPSGYKVKK